MVEMPPFPPPGDDPGAAGVRPVKPAIPVDGKLRCPDHPDARVRVEVVGVLYRCQEEHALDPPEKDNG
jgi:hypothetical protein